MNTFAKSILVGSILSLGLTTAMVAQPGASQYEQWYRAKYGRPAPTELASVTPQAIPTASGAVPQTVPVTEFEYWYRAKYGRPAPTEQALTQATQGLPAGAMPPMVMPMVVPGKDVAANTPAEHERIAQSYRDQANEYLAEARKHQAMLASYKASPNMTDKNQAATINHCEYFVSKYTELAAKSQELAQLHDQMAKAAANQ